MIKHKSCIWAYLLFFLMSMSFVSESFPISPSDITDAFERSKEFEGKIDYDNKHSEKMKKEAEKTYKQYKDKVEPEVNTWMNRYSYENGQMVLKETPKEQKKDENITYKHYLAETERIYIFISSSMPTATLVNYARAIDKLKDDRIVMVLRGCIGGCKKLIPTSEFVQKIVVPSEKEQLQVEVVIDPNLFSLYDIKRVPAFVFATGVSLDVDNGSEGDVKHLKSSTSHSSLYGDVSFDYAIEKINTRINSQRLTQIVAELRKGWYDK